MVAKFTTAIALLLLAVAGGPQHLSTVAGKTGDSPERPATTEQSGGDATIRDREEELHLDEETAAVLKGIREFWKRQPVADKRRSEFPSFRVPPRKAELEMYPCLDCHEDNEINDDKVRKLTEEHQAIVLDHGGGRFWCLTCHNLNNMDFFRSMKDEPIDFNRPYILCGQCHAPRQKDWFFGGHGKRIGRWDGEKVALTCTECHDPHSPSIKPKPPEPPPKRHKGPDGFLTNLKKLNLPDALGFGPSK